MASHVVVIATDLRRTTVKVTPGTYLSDVLQEACKKLNLSSDKFLIKHKQKQVDLSVPFRTSGLVGGAKLELVQRSNTPSAVQIALQIPQPEAKEIPGGRLIKKFPADLTLWKVMRQFESGDGSAGTNVNITARGVASTGSGSGQLYYEMPVLNIMGRELATFEDFQKTLFQLGHNSGNVLIRLTYKKTEQTLFEAMEQISAFFKESEGAAQPADGVSNETNKTEEQKGTRDNSQDATMTDAAAGDAATQESASSSQQAPNSTPGTDTPKDTPDTGSKSPQDPYEPLNVFLAPTGTMPAAVAAPQEESDFMPTVAHAQLHQQRLLENTRNRRLPSDKELEDKAAAEAARIAAIKSVLVKVRFPDNTSSDWQIGPDETGAFLYEAIRHVMANADQTFHLVLPGGKTVIRDESSAKHKLIKEYKLTSRVLVNLVWDDNVPPQVRKQPFLKSNIAKQGQAVKVPEIPKAAEDDKAGASSAPKVVKSDKSEGSGEGGKKVPKWFKFGKK